MSIKFVSGNIFDNEYNVDAFAHGVNLKHVMGAGIAVEFKKRYPKMYEDYVWMCKSGLFKPGSVFPWFEPGKISVLNLATQISPGACAKLEYIRAAFDEILSKHEYWSIQKIAMPRIGAGLGGLDWQDVKSLILACFLDSPLDIIVYESFKQ